MTMMNIIVHGETKCSGSYINSFGISLLFAGNCLLQAFFYLTDTSYHITSRNVQTS